jgi:putative ATPase
MRDEAPDLFQRGPAPAQRQAAPLADRMRPRSLDEVVGQDHLVAEGAPLRALAASGELPSLILWGPPGSGKTTLARLLAAGSDVRFHPLSAVMAGVKDVREAVKRAELDRASGRRFVLFIDEIHRFNRAQQDALLPHVERGTVTLIGASDEAAAAIVHASDGDARRVLNLFESAVALARQNRETPLTPERVREAVGRRVLLHDKDREEHFNVVSALIKSLRASDPDAALYYLARMLAAGEDPLYVGRRLVIFAAEDVGNAEPAALPLATSALLAVERIGMPEGRIPLAQAVTFLACAPKSNASYKALGRAWRAVEELGAPPVPLHLRNAPTPLLRELGYGRDYRYPHDEPDRFVAARNLPEALGGALFYEPGEEGAEKAIAERLREWRRRRSQD